MIDKLSIKSLQYDTEGLAVGRRGENIPLVDCFILRYLCGESQPEDVTMQGLMACMNLSRSAVTAAIGRLVSKGYLLRSQDHKDKRRVIFTLTTEGERVGIILREKEDAHMHFVLRDTTTNEQKAILKFLSRVNQVTVGKYEMDEY